MIRSACKRRNFNNSKASDTWARNLSNILRKSICPISCANSCAINLPKFFSNCAQHVLPVTYAIKWRHSILNDL